MNVTYQVLGVNPEAQILKITREDFSAGICSPEFVNSTLDPTLLDFGIGFQNLTLAYGCDFSWIPLGQFSCQINGFVHIKWEAYGPGECKVSVVVPVLVQSSPWTGINQSKLEEAIREGFDVKWKVDTTACLNCTVHKGVCGYDLKQNQPTCYYSSPARSGGDSLDLAGIHYEFFARFGGNLSESNKISTRSGEILDESRQIL
ncbi:hypothetical protein SO802_019634 [Lithocarpus litseifolius]|uniref:Wall-associated receptor kinase C-terminal domain-containing protein n=1 Tax=Lithocarpus litseifolius TaxID=425828 RepID=A0AAW2CRF0_9ROSI